MLRGWEPYGPPRPAGGIWHRATTVSRHSRLALERQQWFRWIPIDNGKHSSHILLPLPGEFSKRAPVSMADCRFTAILLPALTDDIHISGIDLDQARPALQALE